MKALIVCLVAATLAAPASAATLSHADAAFVQSASQGNDTEIQEGQIFSDSANGYVRDFANRMVTDHTAANTALIAAADRNGMRLGPHVRGALSPSTPQPQKYTAAGKARIMASMPPVAYFQHQVKEHTQAIALYQHELSSGTNADVRTYARKTLPTIQQHLAMAQKDLHIALATQHH